MSFDFEEIENLLANHPSVRLLRKGSAPLTISFLWRAFREERRAAYGRRELTTKLADYLYALNDGGERFPRSAEDYLEAWTNDKYLRQY